MKRFSAIIAVLGITTLINVASAWEFAPGQHCETNNRADVSYGWTAVSANANGAYLMCPVTRTYSSVGTARAYLNNAGGTVSGYINFVSADGSYTNWKSGSTSTSGNTTIDFPAPSNGGKDGFVNFEVSLTAWSSLRGVFTN